MKYIRTLFFVIFGFIYISCENNVDMILDDDKGTLIYTLENKKGIINLNSKRLTNPIYKEISELSEGKYVAGKIIINSLKFAYLDSLGVEISNFTYDDAYPFKEGFSAVKQDGFWIFLNSDLKPISDFKFKMVKDFSEGFAEVKLKSGKWSFINKQGELITDLSFDKIYKFTNGMAPIMLNGKYGYIGSDGVIKIKPQFINWRRFSNHQVAVVSTKKDGWKIVNKQGGIIPKDKSISVDYPYVFDNGLFRVLKNVNGINKYGYMNLREEIKVPIIYNHLEGFHNHNICGGIIEINGKKINCLVSENGKLIKKTNYSYINYYYKGKVAIVYSKFDRLQLKKLHLKIGDVDNDYFTSDGLTGLIDFQGDEVIPTIYKTLTPMYAQYNDKANYFNNQCLFKATKPGSNLIGVLSDNNKVLVPFEYTNISYIYQDAFLVNKNKKNYIYRTKTKKIIPLNNLEIMYTTTRQFKQNYLVVKNKKNNLVGLMNIDGYWKIKPKYEKLMLSEKKYNRK